MSIKIIVIGNCQSTILQTIIKTSLNEVNVPPIKEVHLIQKSDIDNLYTELASSDIVICQLIQDNYRNLPIGTNQIAEKLSPSTKMVIIPNIYFNAYFPNFIYIKNEKGQTVTFDSSKYKGFPSDYYDSMIIAAILLKYDLRDILNIYKTKLKNKWGIDNLTKSFIELKKRESNCDIHISKYLKDNYRKKQLFWTFNHPANDVFFHLTQQIFLFLDISKNIEPLNKERYKKEFMSHITFPTYKFISESLQLEFIPNKFRMHNTQLSYEDFITQCFNMYNKNPELIDINSQNLSVKKSIDILSI